MGNPRRADETADFAAYVDALLRKNPARLDVALIAAEGARRGLFSTEEVALCQRRARLPPWLVEALGGASVPLVPGDVTPIVEPFGPGSGTVGLVEAGPVRLLTHNFNRLALAAGGLVAPMSPPEGRWLASRVAAAGNVPHLPGTTVDAVVEGAALYSHFLFDALPKLVALGGRIDLAGIDNVLLASTEQAFHKEALERLGIDPARCPTRARIGALVDVERVLYVTPVRRDFVCPAALYRAIKDLFSPRNPVPNPPRRVFVSRSRASRRRILNEADLVPLLTARGYAIVHFEDLGIAGAAALLGQAEHIVGLHGAGFANIVFAPEGCRVTEIHGPHLSREYRIICDTLGHRHETLACSMPEGEVAGDFIRTNAADVVVPETALAARLMA